MLIIINILLAILLVILIFYIFSIKKNQQKLQEIYLDLQTKNQKLENEKNTLQLKNQNLEETKNFLQSEYDKSLSRLRDDHAQNLKNAHEQYQNNLSTLKEELQKNFKEQNQALLFQNKNLINEDSKKLLEEIFIPIKNQVKSYEERLLKNEERLKIEIDNMFKSSELMGKNADRLALVLKGDKKIRGNFGEIQLKSVLENSGLIEGEQYKLQNVMHDEDAKYIPDAIIYLEREKSVIVDAKFSLPTQFDFEQITDEIKLELYKNLRARIDELAKKPYASLDSNIYDFVLLFIPYQNILDLALDCNPSLYQYAYEKKVYLTTPHTLFMALKTINITWLNIKRNENVTKAFEEIGKLYDKFAGVIDSFNEIKTHTERLEKAKNDLENKLISGSGNLSNRFRQLEELGIKTKKSLLPKT
ncbi:DNA recombination protein RmuC [Helicobacter anatolicus]|uniref:DNA recombination protein RmuC n=1 Tax=Helicobacter anatolicus TaxID=2905874 RepID=UPI001E5D54ED|nr:DNA recombination protein RmuC [Helicobacter anatolicus]MCE3037152.1 DNA recombination protein RmuC [Helicobacter anatolicus]MCE3040343.1 DNA recombination protein RmuC [Helicobacter anatolicus]